MLTCCFRRCDVSRLSGFRHCRNESPGCQRVLLTRRGKGRHHKFIDKVREVTFNAELARERGQEVLYVTERAVFVLGDDGPVLVEVAPGWTAKQIIALMDFRPNLAAHVRPMSASLFAECRATAAPEPAPPLNHADGPTDKEQSDTDSA